MTKEFFLKLGLKKSQDIKSIYKEPISKEGPAFPIFKRRNIKKKPTITGKPETRIIKPRIIFDTIDERKRYVNPLTQKLVFKTDQLSCIT